MTIYEAFYQMTIMSLRAEQQVKGRKAWNFTATSTTASYRISQTDSPRYPLTLPRYRACVQVTSNSISTQQGAKDHWHVTGAAYVLHVHTEKERERARALMIR